MSKVWDAVGWQAMRSRAAEIVPLALDAYADLSGVLERDGLTFDFHFIPAMVDTLVWSESGPYRNGEPDDFLQDVIATVKRRRQDVITRNTFRRL
ncbi:hypothetical protein ABIE78_000046 [Sinorhizobium fredii]|uniref:Uncharacterized protein n=3 Tax=Rhizobium fredii TaxID=380 RepID=A0A844A356_RHIFR|nr:MULTISPECIES: hypothetical protein [Sinorhizobium]KSV90134.1 hypothetical protein N181_13100 [Sinorhizobium fredii USDA 205]MQX07559.1 hypothetical protein [Sinorhizobium fredii]